MQIRLDQLNDVEKVIKLLKVTEVETSASARYSSQLQLSPGSQKVRPCVCPCVTSSYDTSRIRIFPKLGMMLEDNKSRNVTRPDF